MPQVVVRRPGTAVRRAGRRWTGVPGLLWLLAAPAAAAEAEGGTRLFAGDLMNVIVTLVVFGLVVGILGRYAWGPLLRTLAERERSIRESLEQAERQREEAEALLADYRRRLEQASHEAAAIVEEGRRDAEVLRRRVHEQAQREAQEMIARARREIQLATDAAVHSLYEQAADLAVTLAGQVLGRQLDPAAHRALLEQTLEELRRAPAPRLN